MNLKNKHVFVISDLHLGDGTATDNFMGALGRLEKFLDMVEAKEGILIINGDTFEMWQSELGAILTAYCPLIQRLIKSKTIFTIGNHDMGLDGFIDLPIKSVFSGKLARDIEIKSKNKTIRILHGHQFDPFNNPEKSLMVGRIMSLLSASVERSYPGSGVEGWMQRSVEPVFRNLITYTGALWKKLFSKSGREPSGILNIALDEYNKEHPNDLIVAGHTHKPGWWHDFYVNTGSWQEDDMPHYVEIKSGKVSLHQWPSKKLVESQADLYGYMSEKRVKEVWNNR